MCCMPPAVAAVKTLRTPVSSLLAAYWFGSRGTSTSSGTVHDKEVGSFARLQDKRETHKNAHPRWSGLEDTPREWQLEDLTTQPTASATTFPLENIRILKTTDIDVERSSSGH